MTIRSPRYALLVLGLAAACGGDQKKPASPDATSPEAKPVAQTETAKPAEPAHDAAPAGDKVKVVDGPGDDRFALRITPPADAAVGREGVVTVAAVPQGPWHINLDFPTKLALSAPEGVTLPQPELAKADAAKLDEKSAEFAVKFTPTSPGDKTFTGEFKFAVCQDEACSPVTQKVDFKVAVK
ncbi:hypothetical protein [Nannocystis pusilla]|uniref:Thiol:disulfide interchange protein DsbD N-terminal domain-containing protein n=1 Tax=Nannocystis pusilla TaxID=889268 RepID=A0ABS7U245_9BACT|nr:hypothetical protein [Nannocystis pusilla]MBZ5714530.1 hypothetical protein [Nannocystis pusilla]